MTASPSHLKTGNDIHKALTVSSDQEFYDSAVPDGYAEWYAQLLTTLAILFDGEEIVYGYGKSNTGLGAHVAVFTRSLVATAYVKDTTSQAEIPLVNAVSRRSIASLEVAASSRIDARMSAAYAWPGDLHVVATYPALEHPVVLYGNSFASWEDDNVAPIWRLLSGLREDLQNALLTSM